MLEFAFTQHTLSLADVIGSSQKTRCKFFLRIFVSSLIYLFYFLFVGPVIRHVQWGLIFCCMREIAASALAVT